ENARRRASIERLNHRGLNNVHAVQAVRLQRVVFIEAVVKEAGAETNHHLRRSRAVGCAGRPGDCESGREVVSAVCVRLCLVTQPITKRQVRLDAPIILNEHTVIGLADVCKRITRVDTKLRRAATRRAYLTRRESLLEHTHRQLITFDTRQTKTAGEAPATAEVSLALVVDVDVPDATTELDRVRAHLPRGEVVQLPTLALVKGIAHLRATRTKRAAHI